MKGMIDFAENKNLKKEKGDKDKAFNNYLNNVKIIISSVMKDKKRHQKK